MEREEVGVVLGVGAAFIVVEGGATKESDIRSFEVQPRRGGKISLVGYKHGQAIFYIAYRLR